VNTILMVIAAINFACAAGWLYLLITYALKKRELDRFTIYVSLFLTFLLFVGYGLRFIGL